MPELTLDEKIESLPAKSGVYLFKNEKGKVLYVGKAKNLRNRVKSYFQRIKDLGLRKERMVKKVQDLEIIVTDSEIEALILEANLVKEYRPRYNVNLKDDLLSFSACFLSNSSRHFQP